MFLRDCLSLQEFKKMENDKLKVKKLQSQAVQKKKQTQMMLATVLVSLPQTTVFTTRHI